MYKDNLNSQLPMKILDPMFDNWNSVLGEELDSYKAGMDDISSQFFVDTADSALNLWESFLGLKGDSRLTTDERRGRIKTKLLGQKVITKGTLAEICNQYGYDKVCIDDRSAANTIKFDFSYMKMSMDADRMFGDISSIIPAHLATSYNFLTFTWADITAEGQTWNSISSKKFDDFSPVLNETPKTPVISMDTWDEGDSFSYLDMNLNWSIFESRFSGHDHDGSNTGKLTLTGIAEDVGSQLTAIENMAADSAQNASMNSLVGVANVAGTTSMNTALTAGKNSIVDSILSKSANTTLTHASSLADVAAQIQQAGWRLSETTAMAGDMVAGKISCHGTEYITGTIPVTKNAVGIYAGRTDQVFGAGIYTKDDFNSSNSYRGTSVIIHLNGPIVASSIKKGCTLFGVAGTYDAGNRYTKGDIILAQDLQHNSGQNSFAIIR